ncbi:c-type cytochrome [Nitrospira moscoviensis]|uniref:Putative Cytochrome c55x n=1 Tax=Nitrospira moscoviensis TaxID=42253 RepID=A0A0K2GIA5_NITMO|nr:cytochrome c [Nitrospira moscoviensis]ALA60347.1 putative Cytochrome c55x [Nitrospira moscoviensis]
MREVVIGIGLAVCAAGTILTMAPIAARGDASAGDARKGKVLFVKYCTGCHGTGGQGDGYRLLGPRPADLTGPSTAARSDAELLKTIHEGKPNMPAWRFRFSDEEGRDVLAYVRTLGRHE